jgi:hypothetical protein
MPNLRTAYRWAAAVGDIDIAATIAAFAGFLGFWIEQFETIQWAEDVLDAARAVEHPRLAQLYALATQCYTAGRLEDASRYASAARDAIDSGRFAPVPFGFESWIGGPYIWTGHPEEWLALCRNMIACGRGDQYCVRANVVTALMFTGAVDDAVAESEHFIIDIETIDNPAVICYTLISYGYARRWCDPATSYRALRRGYAIAQESGNRQLESHLAGNVAFLADVLGDSMEALDHLTRAIHNHFDSGSVSLMLTPISILSKILDELGYNESAATLCGFAATPYTLSVYPEMAAVVAHQREVHGEPGYTKLFRVGERMTLAAVVAFALEHIDAVRAELAP